MENIVSFSKHNLTILSVIPHRIKYYYHFFSLIATSALFLFLYNINFPFFSYKEFNPSTRVFILLIISEFFYFFTLSRFVYPYLEKNHPDVGVTKWHKNNEKVREFFLKRILCYINFNDINSNETIKELEENIQKKKFLKCLKKFDIFFKNKLIGMAIFDILLIAVIFQQNEDLFLLKNWIILQIILIFFIINKLIQLVYEDFLSNYSITKRTIKLLEDCQSK